jgi:hypothetical protein
MLLALPRGCNCTAGNPVAVFISAIPPFLLRTADNPEGIDGGVFDGIKRALVADRPAFLSTFLSDFYNVDILKGKCVSDEVVRMSWNIAVGASPKGTLGLSGRTEPCPESRDPHAGVGPPGAVHLWAGSPKWPQSIVTRHPVTNAALVFSLNTCSTTGMKEEADTPCPA